MENNNNGFNTEDLQKEFGDSFAGISEQIPTTETVQPTAEQESDTITLNGDLSADQIPDDVFGEKTDVFSEMKPQGGEEDIFSQMKPTDTPQAKDEEKSPEDAMKDYDKIKYDNEYALFKYSQDESVLSGTLKAVGNIIPSGVGLVIDVAKALWSPLETGKGIGKALTGAILTGSNALVDSGIYPEEVSNKWKTFITENKTAIESKQTSDAIAGYFKERYGSAEGVTKALVEDPVGVLGDLSVIVSGGAGAVAKAGQFSKLTKTAAVASRISEIAAASDPLNVMGRTLKSASKGKVLDGIRGIPNTELIETAEKTGISKDILPATIKTKSKVHQRMFELFGSEGQYSPKAIKAAVQETTNDFLGSIKRNTSVEKIGQLAEKKLGEFRQAFEDTSSALYDAVKMPKKRMNLKKTTEVLQELLAEERKSAVPLRGESLFDKIFANISKKKAATESKIWVPDYIRAQLDASAGVGKPIGRNFDELKADRSRVGKLMSDIQGGPIKTGLKKLYSAMTDDMAELVGKYGDETTQDAFTAANEYYKETMKTLDSAIVESISSKDPAKIVKEVFKPNSPEAIRTYKEVVGESAFAETQGVFVDELLNAATDPTTGNISGGKLRTQIKRYGDDMMNEALGVDELKRLDDIANKADDIADLQKSIGKADTIAESRANNFLMKSVNVLGTFSSLAMMSAAMLNAPMIAALSAGVWGMRKFTRSAAGEAILTGVKRTAEESKFSRVMSSPAMKTLSNTVEQVGKFTPDTWAEYMRIIEASKDE